MPRRKLNTSTMLGHITTVARNFLAPISLYTGKVIDIRIYLLFVSNFSNNLAYFLTFESLNNSNGQVLHSCAEK